MEWFICCWSGIPLVLMDNGRLYSHFSKITDVSKWKQSQNFIRHIDSTSCINFWIISETIINFTSLQRSIKLFFIGFCLINRGVPFDEVRIMGVLQRFGISYFIVASIHVIVYYKPKDILPEVLPVHTPVIKNETVIPSFLGKIKTSSVRHSAVGIPMVLNVMYNCNPCNNYVWLNSSWLPSVFIDEKLQLSLFKYPHH